MEALRTIITSTLASIGHSGMEEATKGYDGSSSQIDWKHISPFFNLLLNGGLIVLISLIIRSKLGLMEIFHFSHAEGKEFSKGFLWINYLMGVKEVNG